MEVDLSKKKVWQLEDVLDFGKYKGQQIKDVVQEEPTILIWYQNNVEWFELDEDILLQCEELAEAEQRARRERFGQDFPQGDWLGRDHGDDDEIPF